MKRSFCYYLKWFGVNGSAWILNDILPSSSSSLFDDDSATAAVVHPCINLSLSLSLYLIFHTLILLIAFNGMSRAFTLLIDFPLPIHLNFCRRFPNELLFNIRLFYRIYSVCVCAMYLRCICSNFVCSRTGLLNMFIG